MKTQGIREMPPSTTRDELETVYGMVTYLGKFAPNLADVTAPLSDFTKKENEFIWDAVKDKAYEDMKQMLCKQPVQFSPTLIPGKTSSYSATLHRKVLELSWYRTDDSCYMHRDV